MSFDVIFGSLLLFAAMGFLIALLLRSDRIIRFIQKNHLHSAREIQRRWHGK